MQSLVWIGCGQTFRLDRLLRQLRTHLELQPWDGQTPLAGRRVLLTAAADDFGPDPAVSAFLRQLRRQQELVRDGLFVLLADGSTETDTKAMSRDLIYQLDRAGARFPERPLVEGTGSLRNQRVTMTNLGLGSLEDAYFAAAGLLIQRLLSHVAPRWQRPRLLMLHASDHATSNTLALGEQVTGLLSGSMDITVQSLRNGAIEDCRGCSYKVCSHFASRGACFYGGSIAQEVLPAVLESDILLLLAPNYNDAVGANLMAFINRLTSLHVSNALAGRYVYAIVVSGYSGGDIVAKQLLGALCLNKSLLLPPEFCLMETANNPGEAAALPGIQSRVEEFARRIARQTLLPD